MKITKLYLYFLLLLATSLQAQDPIVWPGDVNNNGIVNEVDLLLLGLGFGDMGPERKTVSAAWEAQPIPNLWATSAAEGVDLGYFDCNGDGLIGANDVEVIRENFGRTHTDVTFKPDEVPVGIPGTSPAFGIPADANLTITPATTSINIGLTLGDSTIAVNNLLGLSFYIKADPQVFTIEQEAFQLEGWLIKEEVAIIQEKIQTGRSGPGDFVVAMTKNNRQSSSGSGLIGSIDIKTGFILEDDVPNFKITIDSILLLTNTNTKIPVLGTEIVFVPEGFKDSTMLTSAICPGESFAFNNAMLSEAGTYRDTLMNQYGRDSILILEVAVLEDSEATMTQQICQGESYAFNNAMLTDAGIYRDTLMNFIGCDSVVVLDLLVATTDETPMDAAICAGESYAFNNAALKEAGMYRDTFQNFNGCDSIVVLSLTVDDTVQTVLDRTICSGDSFLFNENSLTTSGAYRDTLVAPNGCNQYVTLNLIVEETFETNIDRQICAGDSFLFNETMLSEAGSYLDTLVAPNGCDQYVQLNLSIKETIEQEVTAIICAGESYAFNNQALTDGGMYEETTQAASGCDSLTVLNLIVTPTTEATYVQSICAGESLDFNGQMLTDAGMYQDTRTGANGCDSMTIMQLTINKADETLVNQTICENSTYAFNGQELSTAGEYQAMLTNVNGCDSLVTLDLKVSDRYETEMNQTICEGESMNFNGGSVNETGTYQHTYLALNGCDSLVTLNLAVANPAYTAMTAEICQGGFMLFNNQNISAEGVYLDTLSTVSGCDSLVELTLSVAPIYESASNMTICEGESVDFYNFVLTTTNSYMVILQTADACDSMVIMNLVVLDNIETTIDSTICPGDGMLFGNTQLTAAGTYTQSLSGASGCDSMVVLNLTIGTASVEPCKSVGIEEELLESIEIYPNPVKESLFINSPSVKMKEIQLINITGQTLINQSFNKGNAPEQATLNLQDVVSGVYWVLIQTEYGLRQEKIVKF